MDEVIKLKIKPHKCMCGKDCGDYAALQSSNKELRELVDLVKRVFNSAPVIGDINDVPEGVGHIRLSVTLKDELSKKLTAALGGK